MGIEKEADLTGVLEKYESIPAIMKEVLNTMDLQLALKLCKLIGTKVSSMERLAEVLHLLRTQIGEAHEISPEKIKESQDWLEQRGVVPNFMKEEK
jgi:hypothetical protein